MDSLVKYRRAVRQLIEEVASYEPSEGEVIAETVFDEERGHYELLCVGWEEGHYVHDTLIHIDIRGEKVWIQCNETNLLIGEELVKAGVPRQQIVLGFQPPYKRPDTGFAVA